jgi:hypothetical protein
MALPEDFDEALARIEKLGITAEGPPQIRDRLILAIRAVAEQSSQTGDLAVGDLGFFEWSTKTLRRCEIALRGELCDGEKGCLKAQYKNVFDKAASDGNLRQIASLATSALATIAPSLAISSVVVYFALWLAKVGLGYWCKQPSLP